LDQFSLSDVKRWPREREQIMQLEWECYSSLAHQRARIIDSIRNALQAASEGPFTFERWQRTVKYKWVFGKSCGQTYKISIANSSVRI
jgi:hypothetical protein